MVDGGGELEGGGREVFRRYAMVMVKRLGVGVRIAEKGTEGRLRMGRRTTATGGLAQVAKGEIQSYRSVSRR
ncbi:hypothetical protein NL676_008604 [Syzygium grande]|nr:hypothetical protein NL676_008604 [Syzygium grande]